MIIHAIELTHVGRFRQSVRLGPFAPGLNVLAAPNESGKSTAVRAAARALFDRHTTKGEELTGLQPTGTELAPHMAVEFETGVGRFRIEKTFLLAPRSVLKQWQGGEWQPIAETDLADQKVQALLQSSMPGRGATKSEHWGFMGFLWARQEEPAAWPRLDDPGVGQKIRARLARVELDPVIEKLRQRLADAANAIITNKGQAKANGDLDVAERDLLEIEGDLSALRKQYEDLEAANRRFQQAEAMLNQHEKEHVERSQAAAVLRDQAAATERLRTELGAHQAALEAAKEKLAAVNADTTALEQRRSEMAGAKAALIQAEKDSQAAEAALTVLRTRLDERQAARSGHEESLITSRTALDRIKSLLKLRQLADDAGALARQLAKAETAAAKVAALEAKKAAIPALSPAKLKKFEEQDENIRTLRAQLQALGLTVELTPDQGVSVVAKDAAGSKKISLPAGEPHRLHSPQTLELTLKGWGRVHIRSGAQEAQNAAAELAETEIGLREALQEAGIASLQEAREAIAHRKDIEGQLKAAQDALATHLGDCEEIAELRAAAAQAANKLEALTSSLAPTPAEQAQSLTVLETAEAKQGEMVPAAEKALKLFDRETEQLRADERAAAKASQEATKGVGERRTLLNSLEAQIGALVGRYPEGIEPARKSAQLGFGQAEARVIATTAQLPPDFEKLPERNKRAAAALQQLEGLLLAERAERDLAKGSLETLGGQGLYSRETELEEKKTEAALRRDAARVRGWGARIAHDLIELRKQAATRAVLAPLETRLTAAFARLTGEDQRGVFLDENLQIAGIGRTREASHAFELLSQGAKEQLLLCLRIAVAQELAADEPQVLILDDVLVNSDEPRRERVIEMLTTLAPTLQVIILTCHENWYRGVGTAVSIVPQAGTN
jgi:uncharacterized protein YhaN